MLKETNEILAYTAGIIDGEGCISIAKNTSPRCCHIFVIASNTNEWLVNFLQFNFGGSICKKEGRSECKPCYTWTLSARRAGNFLGMILPFLQLKRPQAELALLFQKRRYGPGRRGKSDEERALDEAAILLMHKFNKKGRYEKL